MKLSINEIADLIHARVIGNPDGIVKGVSSFDESGPDDITFAVDSKYLNQLDRVKAGAVIVPDTFNPDLNQSKKPVLLKTDNPKRSFFKISSLFYPETIIRPFIHHTAHIGQLTVLGENPVIEANVFIGNSVKIGKNVHLMPGVYIGDDVVIGDRTIIKPNVTVLDKTRIGQNVVIHSGTVIGSDGFGFTPGDHDQHQKIIHTGYVSIGNNSEIGACNTIDRGTLGTTVIGNGVKTDNLVHIAHNVKIGDNTLIVAQAGIAGSAIVGENVIIAGKAGISGHIKIGNRAVIGPYSGVHTDVGEEQVVSGIPQIPHVRWRKVVSIISRLPEMRKAFFSFEKRLKRIETESKQTEQK